MSDPGSIEPILLDRIDRETSAADVSHGLGRFVSLRVYEHPTVVCVACFRWIGKHYHMPMLAAEWVPKPYMIRILLSNPDEAIESVIASFLQLPQDKRSIYEVKE